MDVELVAKCPLECVRVEFINLPFMPNVFSHPYQLYESISNYICLGLVVVIFNVIQILKETSVCKQ